MVVWHILRLMSKFISLWKRGLSAGDDVEGSCICRVGGLLPRAEGYCEGVAILVLSSIFWSDAVMT